MSKELSTGSAPRPKIPVPLRVQGECMPTAAILAAADNVQLPVRWTQTNTGHDGAHDVDESAIDPTLHVATGHAPAPLPGVGYAGMTPVQRHQFLTWAGDATAPAAPAFQQLYVANLEPYLLESPAARGSITRHLVSLSLAPSWTGNLWLTRAILLALWLEQAGTALANWLDQGRSAPALLGTALGQQALLGVPMQPGTLAAALAGWQIGHEQATPDLLKLRLASLATVLGNEPLAAALTSLPDGAAAPRPWRAANRLIRLDVPQPDIRPALEPLLRDLPDPVEDESVPAPDEASEDDDAPRPDKSWQLILEFGHSRSDFFDYALKQAQKQAGYSQLMDENRQMVYRVAFRKGDMRRFWRLWEYVQGWTSTRVYLNGDELEKWKVWPYSQYLR